jgi:hypothetical protein
MSDDPKPARKAVDWEAVEREYRAGQLSVREIGRLFNVSHVAIGKRAKKDGWIQNLAERVREEVTSRLVTSDVSKANAKEAIEVASLRGVEMVLSHRRDISQLRAIATIIATRLAEHLQGVKPDGEFLGQRESVGDLLEKLTRTRARLIPLERQAFNLDADCSSDEPATKSDIASAVRKLNGDQREQLRSIAQSLIVGSGGDAS